MDKKNNDFTRWGIDGIEIEYPLGYACLRG